MWSPDKALPTPQPPRVEWKAVSGGVPGGGLASLLLSWPLAACDGPGGWRPLFCRHPGSWATQFGLTFLSPLPVQNRGRLADKRTVALPPARVLKKELTPSFSASGDSDRSGPACGQRLGLKQEDDPHVRIMKRRCCKGQGGRARGQDGDVRTGVSRQLKATSGFGWAAFALGIGPRFRCLCLRGR